MSNSNGSSSDDDQSHTTSSAVSIGTVHTDLVSVNSGVQSLQDAVIERLSSLEAAQNTTNTTLQGVQTTLQGVQTTLQGVQTTLQGVQIAQDTTNSRLHEISAQLQDTNLLLRKFLESQRRCRCVIS